MRNIPLEQVLRLLNPDVLLCVQLSAYVPGTLFDHRQHDYSILPCSLLAEAAYV